MLEAERSWELCVSAGQSSAGFNAKLVGSGVLSCHSDSCRPVATDPPIPPTPHPPPDMLAQHADEKAAKQSR